MMNVVDLVLHEISARKHFVYVRSTNPNSLKPCIGFDRNMCGWFLFFAAAFDHVEDHCGFEFMFLLTFCVPMSRGTKSNRIVMYDVFFGIIMNREILQNDCRKYRIQ